MKKSILSLLMISLLVMMTNSCSKSNPSTSGGKYSWSCEVNGKSYSWSGSYPDGTNPSSMGFSTFTERILAFSLPAEQNKIPFSFVVSFKDVPTVKVENGYYEVMQKSGENGGVVPVLRVPMANTNMLIRR